MKKTVWTILTLLTSVFSLNATAQDKIEFSGNCMYPDKPAGVDGSTASEAQMLAFQKDLKDYLAKGNEFLSCLDKEESMVDDGASSEAMEEFKARITQSYNAVVDEMNSLADDFNTALRAYKAQNQ